VLEKVRKSRAVAPLVLAADIVEQIGGDHWGDVILVQDHMQPVRQIELSELNGTEGISHRKKRDM
jgi:hypothetical protein